MQATISRSKEKWADWCIVEEHHEQPNQRGRIIAVDVRPDFGEQLGAEQRMTIVEVMARWAHGETFCTATLGDGKWRRGAQMVPELRTVPNRDPDDNLD
jgi:hypothetical protein